MEGFRESFDNFLKKKGMRDGRKKKGEEEGHKEKTVKTISVKPKVP